MYSRSIHNINLYLNNLYPHLILSRLLQNAINPIFWSFTFMFQTHEKNMIIFCCDPNDINVISFKEVKELAYKIMLNLRNKTYTGFITGLKNNFFDELRGRIKFTKEQRNELNKQLN
jgi:hypothetical protein